MYLQIRRIILIHVQYSAAIQYYFCEAIVFIFIMCLATGQKKCWFPNLKLFVYNKNDELPKVQIRVGIVQSS